MADNIENRLQVGLGFKIDDIGGGLADLATNADKIGKVMEQLAKAMGNIEQGSKGVEESTKKSGRGFSDVTKILNEYKAGITNVNEALTKLKKIREELDNKKDNTQNEKEYDKVIQKLAKVNTEIAKLEKQRTATIKQENNIRIKEEKAFNDAIKKQAQETAKFQRQQLQQTTSAYKQAMNERKASSKMLGEMLSPVNTNFSNKLLTSAVQWTGAYALVHEFQNLGREIVDIEYNTINNMRLMGDFSDELRESLNASAAEIARNTGIMITDAQEIQGAWIRINDEYAKSPKLLGEMAEITSKFMNVGEIEDAESAVKLLNSTLLQFNLNTGNVAANAEEIANKFAYMADKTAMGTADEYAEGIAKMGANIKNMNGDVDDAIVLLSIVGDKLAKNGTEAGNSLNTFTAYMHTTKTLKLFDGLQEQMQDLDVSLRDGENGLKNFEDSLTAIATAYQRLKEEGDQVGMNQIIEALGATRQRATAQAMLEAISDGQTLQEYYELLEGATASGNYLEQQNEALMSTLANQFKSLVATLQEAGMYISNSGLLDGLTLLMNGFEGLLKVVTLIPQPFITGVTAILGYKTAIAGLDKLGQVTGLTDKLIQSAKFGSAALVEEANSARMASDAFLNYQKSIFGAESASARLTSSYQSQLSVLASYEEGVARANMQLAQTGNVQGYTNELARLKAEYQKSVVAINAKKLSTEELNAVQKRNQLITETDNVLGKTENAIREKSLITLLREQGLRKADTLLRKTSIGTKVADKVATLALAASKKVENLQTKLSTGSTIANTVAKGALTGATWLATTATTAFGAALNFLLSPTVLITGAIAGLTWLFSKAKDQTVDFSESLSNLEEALRTGRERVQELREAQANTGDADGTIQRQIDKQKELNESYEKSILLLKQKQFYDDYYADGDEDNKDEKIDSNINELNEYSNKVAELERQIINAQNNIKAYEEKVVNGETITDTDIAKYNSATANLKQLQDELNLTRMNASAAAAELNLSAQEIRDAYDDGLISDELWNSKFKGLVDKIEGYRGKINSFLTDVKTGIEEIGESLSTSFDLSSLMNQMDSLAESTKSLVEAQNQLAQGATLSKDHLWELAMQYPELLYQANLFADGSVEGQRAAIDAILDMKNQEFNNAIDLKIAELDATKDFIEGILDYEQQKLDAITTGEIESANGRISIEADTARFINEYNNLIGQQHNLANQYMVDSTASSGEARVDAENQTGEKTVDIYNETALESATAMTEGSAAGVEGASKNASLLGNLFDKIKGWASNLATWVAKAFAGDESGSGSVNGDTVSGIRTVSFNKATYDKVDNTIDGKTIKEWTEIQKEVLKQNVDVYKVQLQGLNNAITNLETFKNIGLTGVSNQYSDKGAQGGTGKSGEAAKAAEKAANAAEKAAKETEKIAEEIEKIAQQYVKNVESMQDRIAKALKKKYQEQYDERKKLLEKEHEARVQQIQDEIDKINGNTTQDKKSELERLQEKYEQWSKDDSTLGKARQKEYLDQIKELEKEIKIDELEKQLDEENEKYDQSIDKDSQFYDAILKKLDSQMTDEMLYREANDMIRNGKIDEITALLTKYDAQWDGWATLMGKTAGEIIAEEVALAIANYLDVVQGTITQDGGTHTNAITGGSSSASKNTSTSTHSGSSTGTTGGTVTTGSKVKINDTSTGMYYTSTSGGAVGNWSGYSGSYYVVNSNAGRVALARDNNVNNAIGWISKSKVTKLATGGYTGLGEGLAYLHAKERVLNARQTAAFENLIYNQLPKLERQSINGGNFGGTTNNFNKELVKVEVDTINNYDSADVTNMGDNLDRLVRVSLQKSGIRRSR